MSARGSMRGSRCDRPPTVKCRSDRARDRPDPLHCGVMTLLLSLVLACTDAPVDSAPSATDDPTGDEVALDVTAELGTIVTVVIVRWHTTEPTTGWVEFGPDEAYGTQTNATELGTEHEVLLVGTPADTLVHFRVHVDTEAGELTTSDHTITTGPLPSGTPQFVASGELGDEWQFTVLPTQGEVPAVTIVNGKGDVVWYYLPKVVEGNLMRALLTHDRKAVLLGHAGIQGDLSTSVLQYISLDGGTVRDILMPNFDHDLVELPDGTVTMIMVDTRTHPDGAIWQADRIVELAPDGSQRQVFNAWDALNPDEIDGPPALNWTHGNGLDYWPEEDAYLFSMKELGTVAKISRSTGQIEWMINGRLNQFDFGDDEVVQLQHQFEMLSDGHLLLFDNGTQERGYSRAVELELDIGARTATQVWEYIRTPPVYVFAKGDVQRFDSGQTLVTWSAMGELQMVTPEGLPTWQLNAELGQAFTFVQPFSSFYDAR